MACESPKLRIEYVRTFKNLKVFIDRYNQSAPGNNRIHGNMRASAELILRLYIRQLQAAHIRPGNRLPPFTSFNESLAKTKGCTKRTIINHRHRLSEVGLFTEDVNKGSHGICISFTPEILAIHSSTPADNSSTHRKETSLFSSRVKKSHPLVHEHIFNIINSNVDKLITSSTASIPKKLPMNTKENVASAGIGSSEKESDTRSPIFYSSLVKETWQTAKSMLYPFETFTTPQEEYIKKFLRWALYRNFNQQGSLTEWLDYHKTVLDRIKMVRKWLTKSPTHWIPPPIIYFNPRNKKDGFTNTWGWSIKKMILKLELQNEELKQQLARSRAKPGSMNRAALYRLKVYQKNKVRLKNLSTDELVIHHRKSQQTNHRLRVLFEQISSSISKTRRSKRS